MKTIFDFSESLERIETILKSNGEQYRKYPYIPEDDVIKSCRGCFVDGIVLISRLYFRATDVDFLILAKLYDAYINEARTILLDHPLCRKVLVHGNTISSVFNIGTEDYMNSIIEIAGKMISLPNVINYKAGRRTNPYLGNVCAMETGFLFAKWMPTGTEFFGGMMNRAEQWIAKPSEKEELSGLFISDKVHVALKQSYKDLFYKTEMTGLFHGSVENRGMLQWVEEQK